MLSQVYSIYYGRRTCKIIRIKTTRHKLNQLGSYKRSWHPSFIKKHASNLDVDMNVLINLVAKVDPIKILYRKWRLKGTCNFSYKLLKGDIIIDTGT